MQNIRWPNNGCGKRLVIPSCSVAPGYKIMLHPYRHGEDVPVATWVDRDKTTLSLRWQDHEGQYTFTMDEFGRTRTTLKKSKFPLSVNKAEGSMGGPSAS